ncbi:MAG: hypothetical protein HKO57_05725 [Akkermansiaceae bacterium]|nr:hypothetical protein [Akkermansiaceae bacterium]
MPSLLTAVLAGCLLLTAAMARADDPAPSVRILAYNIKHGRGMDGKVDLRRAAAVIAAQNPDLVALQEVDRNCTRSGKVDIAAELGRILGMDHRFAKFMDFQGGEYGLAVLSRLPITKSVRHQLPAGAEPRCALEVRVRFAALTTPLSFLSIHHDWTDAKIRVGQVEALLAALEGHRHPVILAGDFNGERDDPSVIRLARSGWNVLRKDDPAARHTFPSDAPRKEIDFFMLRGVPAVHVTHHVVDERLASDHRPIAAVLTFEKKAGPAAE